MGYVGNQTSNSYTSITKQDITGDGGTGYTLDHAVANAQEIEVFVNNVRQEPGVAYTVSGTTLTMTGNVAASDDFYVVFQGKAIQTTVPPDDSVTTARINDGAVTTAKIEDDAVTAAKINDGAVTSAKLADTYQSELKVAVIVDEKSANTQGGTFTSGAWRHRDLNTEVFDPDGIVTIASNQFTLGAGTYIIEFEAPAYNTNRHQTRLYDVTGSAVVEYGSSGYSNTSGGDNSLSRGYARVVITANNTYKIEHRCTTTSSTYGYGVGSDYGVVERYTMVKITKLA